MSTDISKFILAIDQGTTSSRAIVFNHRGEMVSDAQAPFAQIFPQPSWVEHDPETIWNTVVSTIRLALEKAKISGSQIASIGITNQRETIVAWDRRSHRPVYNAIVWQCRRTHEFCNKILKPHGKTILNKTGLVIDPYFSGSKISWILKNVKEARDLAKLGQLAVGTIDSFLIWRLTGGQHVTDVTNASRTQLLNIHKLNWDEELLKIFGVSLSMLPEVRPSSGYLAETHGLEILPNGIPITGVAGDQQAALFGQLGFQAGQGKVTFGTGSFLLVNTGNKVIRSRHRLLSTVAWQIGNSKPVYALEGSVFVCGAAIQWLRDGLGLLEHSDEATAMAKSVVDTGGVEFVPALTGMGAPHWNAEARGMILGLTRGTNKAHLVRATIESMALQNVDLLNAIEKDLGKSIKSLRVDGGAVRNDLLLQLQSDFKGCLVQRPKNIESTALGAAFLAGLGSGYWNGIEDIKKLNDVDKEFKPSMSGARRKKRLEHWAHAVKICKLAATF